MTTAETTFVTLAELSSQGVRYERIGMVLLAACCIAALLAIWSRGGSVVGIVSGVIAGLAFLSFLVTMEMDVRSTTASEATRRVATLEEEFGYRNVTVKSRGDNYTFTASASKGEYVGGLIVYVNDEMIAVTTLDAEELLRLLD